MMKNKKDTFKGGEIMRIQLLKEYIKICSMLEIEPSFKGVNQFKEVFKEKNRYPISD